MFDAADPVPLTPQCARAHTNTTNQRDHEAQRPAARAPSLVSDGAASRVVLLDRRELHHARVPGREAGVGVEAVGRDAVQPPVGELAELRQ